MHCFVDASFPGNRKGSPKDQPTDTTLRNDSGLARSQKFLHGWARAAENRSQLYAPMPLSKPSALLLLTRNSTVINGDSALIPMTSTVAIYRQSPILASFSGSCALLGIISAFRKARSAPERRDYRRSP
jgi:hypothetical protein